MAVILRNNIRTRLAAPVAVDASRIRVSIGHGTHFPTLSHEDDWFPLVLENAAGDIEICHALARTGDVFTVRRGQEGTQPRAFAAGDAAELRLTVAALKELIFTVYEVGVTVSVSGAVITEEAP